ncbi:UPF0280 family protein [Clostridia bacterium]|nr:UPF0280 family protein [Clostridia bacterium]
MGKRFPHHFLLKHQASDIWVGLGEVQEPERLEISLKKLQKSLYTLLDCYIEVRPEFNISLNPIAEDPSAPAIVQTMIQAGKIAGTGPMAAVAGTFAQCIAEQAKCMGVAEVIAENGGDLFVDCAEDLVIAIYAGDSPFSNRIGLTIRATEMPISLCTSSGTVGHSFSFGKADAVVVKAKEGALADAMATAICNQIGESQPIEPILEKYLKYDGIDGILAVRRDQLVVVGQMLLTRI